jgi:hypothetical protein
LEARALLQLQRALDLVELLYFCQCGNEVVHLAPRGVGIRGVEHAHLTFHVCGRDRTEDGVHRAGSRRSVGWNTGVRMGNVAGHVLAPREGR